MRILKTALCFLMIFFLTGCASIVSKTNWPFSIDTEPAGAKVVIKNKKGHEVFRGKTPTALKLKSGAAFFSKESYTVSITMSGYESKILNIECKLNAWYFGNIVLGGLVGMLIIDPATGAMYKLNTTGISEELTKLTEGNGTSFNIINKNDIPANLIQHLIKIGSQNP